MTEQVSTIGDARLDQLAGQLAEHFSECGCKILQAVGEITLVIPSDQLLETAKTLRDHEAFRFEELIDVCGVDYAAYAKSEWATEAASSTGFGRGVDRDQTIASEDPERFAVVYHLLSVKRNRRLRLRVYATGPQPTVDSVVEIWNGANWFEREAFDLYGILFRGHPDLRRILSDYGFAGYPFRKDFPLIGQVEMRYDPEQQRVVYEPVSIEPRTLVPKVIREDSRYLREDAEPTDATNA